MILFYVGFREFYARNMSMQNDNLYVVWTTDIRIGRAGFGRLSIKRPVEMRLNKKKIIDRTHPQLPATNSIIPPPPTSSSSTNLIKSKFMSLWPDSNSLIVLCQTRDLCILLILLNIHQWNELIE